MAARFEVHRAFALEPRALFVLAGVIREGTVAVGMNARLEGGEAFDRPVHGVEFLDEGDGPPGQTLPCLTFHCRDDGRMKEWLGMDWSGKVLELSW